MSTTLVSALPASGMGRYPIASSACTNGPGSWPDDAFRKNSALHGADHSLAANSLMRSQRGRCSGVGRMPPRIALPSVASMFSPSTSRYVVSLSAIVNGSCGPALRSARVDRGRHRDRRRLGGIREIEATHRLELAFGALQRAHELVRELQGRILLHGAHLLASLEHRDLGLESLD